MTGADAGFVYSYYAAPPAPPWWRVEQTPAPLLQVSAAPPRYSPAIAPLWRRADAPHRAVQNVAAGRPWVFAGACSPCRTGSDVEANDKVLCTYMGGYGRFAQVVLVPTVIPVPSSPADFRVYYTEPRFSIYSSHL